MSVVAEHRPAVVDLWQAGLGPWRRVSPGDLILLKRQGSVEDIIGYGFVYYRMPAFTSAVWERYGPATGAANRGLFEEQVARKHSKRSVADPVIGNIIIENPVLFPERPFKLFQQSEMRPEHYLGSPLTAEMSDTLVLLLSAHAKRCQMDEAPVQTPLAEGTNQPDSIRFHAWEDAVRSAYGGGCAVMPVKVRGILRVVAIKPFEYGGPYLVSNGVLLNLNLATLHDKGLITFHINGALVGSPDLALQDPSLYGALAGKLLKPAKRPEDLIDKDLLEWRLLNLFKR